ncbi:MAG: RNA-binding S4 domain-containing protein [Bacteroidetes bacterium]|nr:RNA-binding S4 domain-containing protein [Bacteroidota bacterium]
METPTQIRVDKWLWAVRQYKTRSLATKACEQGKIIIQGQAVKPSRHVKIGEEIKLKRTGLVKTLKVLNLTSNRLNAKLVSEYAEDLTPPEEIAAYKARASRVTIFRDPGTGRPTKRERRDLDDFMGEY